MAGDRKTDVTDHSCSLANLVTCTFLHKLDQKSAAYRILEARGDCCHQPAEQWHCSDQKPEAVTCCISGHKKTEVTNLVAQMVVVEGFMAMNLESQVLSIHKVYVSITSILLAIAKNILIEGKEKRKLYEEWLRPLGLFSLEKKKLRRDLIVVFNILTRGSRRAGKARSQKFIICLQKAEAKIRLGSSMKNYMSNNTSTVMKVQSAVHCLCCLEKETNPHLTTATLQEVVESDKVSLESPPTFQQIDTHSQLSIIYRFINERLSPLINVINKDIEQNWPQHRSLRDTTGDCWMPAGCSTVHHHSLGPAIQPVVKQKCLPTQQFPNLLARQLVKLKLPPTLGTNPPGFSFPIHTPSLFPEKISGCQLRLPAWYQMPSPSLPGALLSQQSPSPGHAVVAGHWSYHGQWPCLQSRENNGEEACSCGGYETCFPFGNEPLQSKGPPGVKGKGRWQMMVSEESSAICAPTKGSQGTQPPDLQDRDREQNEASTIQEGMISELLCNLDQHKSMRPDRIHPRVPGDWKLANVMPIYKRNWKKDPENYRLVSLILMPCKVMSKSAIMKQVQDNQEIRPSQHGLVKGRSCLTDLLSFYGQVTHLVDKGKAVVVVYLDFSKALDTISHIILLERLS
ncbi:hypothetical protein RLOC_00011756 [Lonchura striata]|uniref:Reverse transcriptase domain-containing protein n=1 Tax=Lonchura striata TaxID=40157 RepID=A0A218V711_9PASE|nr:hypothetical protein RLOC_00011756 [Lonchura striata domestica]